MKNTLVTGTEFIGYIIVESGKRLMPNGYPRRDYHIEKEKMIQCDTNEWSVGVVQRFSKQGNGYFLYSVGENVFFTKKDAEAKVKARYNHDISVINKVLAATIKCRDREIKCIDKVVKTK